MKLDKLLSSLWNHTPGIFCVIVITLVVMVSCAAPMAMEPAEEPAAAPQETRAAMETYAPQLPTVPLAPTVEEIIPSATVEVLEPTPAELIHHEQRLIEMEWPAQMRVGDSDVIRLSLVMDEQGQITPTAIIEGHAVAGEPVQIPNLYDTHNLVAEARLDLLGIESIPQGTVSEPLKPGKTVNFFWNIQSHEAGVYRGTLWLHVNIVPRGDVGQIEKVALLAKPIEIETTTILGLSSQMARIFSLSGSLLSTIIGFPFLESILKFLWKKIRTTS